MDSEPVDALILDLLEWIDSAPRPYREVMDVWRTSCPRLPVWEEANRRGLLVWHPDPSTPELITLSPAGSVHLRRHRPAGAVS